MRNYCILFLGFLFSTQTVQAQHIQLIENKGEIGVTAGVASYIGDIAPDIQFLSKNYGAFYKRQLNDYIGIRFNYEYLDLAANDGQSNNAYINQRNLYFQRTFHDLSIMGEFYFLRFIDGNKRYRFSPYLGFGFGALKSISWTPNLTNSKTQRTLVMPINFGLKYNVKGPWNVLAEATYRFTNSDYIDFFGDENSYKPPYSTFTYQPSTSGNDQYFSLKMGISYSLLSIYGPDYAKKEKKGFFEKSQKNGNNSSKTGIFSIFKRK
jgi:hypothetical protein